ncbi:MAG TPA: endo alpha-1,4 polygalactosaminidase, partial [Kofleriaceae bacterium]|nr:endo alpha-1,4 polygalactosaminidase [Kofleriaceae bacterium]
MRCPRTCALLAAAACGSSSSTKATTDAPVRTVDAAPIVDTSPGTHWVPAAATTFFWDLQSTPPDNTHDVGAYDIDGFGNTADEVSALHALGKRVVCYMDAGTYEPARPDSAQFPAALLGSDVVGWPGEKWLDVRPAGPNYATLQSIMSARFAICRQKGFDAVEPDNLDSYQNSGGFNATAAD